MVPIPEDSKTYSEGPDSSEYSEEFDPPSDGLAG
jgi:hypothetical protein